MAFAKGILGGLICGAVGVGLWAGVGYATGYELGFLAWAVGGLVGAGALLACKGQGSVGLGVAACVIAVGAILGGKFTVASLVVQDMAEEHRVDDRDLVVIALADEIVAEKEEAGIEIVWPEEGDHDAATTHGYPAAIWKQAAGRFNSLSFDEREAVLSEMKAGEAVATGAVTGIVFLVSVLRPMSLVWIGLAVASCYKFASARASETEVGVMPGFDTVGENAVLRPIPGTDVAAEPQPALSASPLPALPTDAVEDDGLPLMSGRPDAGESDRRAA